MSYPDKGEHVLIIHKGQWRIAAIEWEYPTFEDTYPAFPYWYDPYNDSGEIEWEDVTHWQELPSKPLMDANRSVAASDAEDDDETNAAIEDGRIG